MGELEASAQSAGAQQTQPAGKVNLLALLHPNWNLQAWRGSEGRPLEGPADFFCIARLFRRVVVSEERRFRRALV